MTNEEEPQPPAEVLDTATVARSDVVVLPWRVPIWKVRLGGAWCVLRRSPVNALMSLEDLLWQHQVQRRLRRDHGFDVPQPLPAFDGSFTLQHQGYLWEMLSWVRGRTLGWSPQPPLDRVGAAMKELHDRLATDATPIQRPSAVPIRDLHAMADLGVIDRSLPDVSSRSLFRRFLGDVTDRNQGLTAGDPRLIHGDLTTLNVLTDGRRITGVIDFNNAYLETHEADIGFSLWQSGRPSHEDHTLDPGRISSLLRGYVRQIPHPASAVTPGSVFGWIQARGLQLMVRSSLREPRDLYPPLKLLIWLDEHESTVIGSLTAGMSG